MCNGQSKCQTNFQLPRCRKFHMIYSFFKFNVQRDLPFKQELKITFSKAIIEYTPRPRAIARLTKLRRLTRLTRLLRGSRSKIQKIKRETSDLHGQSFEKRIWSIFCFSRMIFLFKAIFGALNAYVRNLRSFNLSPDCLLSLLYTGVKLSKLQNSYGHHILHCDLRP